jgi:8-oxo-dGTP pyrophosphatase MutT (NUDIX family)
MLRAIPFITSSWASSHSTAASEDPRSGPIRPATSLVPAVNVVVVNDAGEILLIRRTDNGNWALPGGAIDLGESFAQAAVRETLEESGIECAITASSASTPTPGTSSSTPPTARHGRSLHRPDRPATGRTADSEQQVKRGPLDLGSRTSPP